MLLLNRRGQRSSREGPGSLSLNIIGTLNTVEISIVRSMYVAHFLGIELQRHRDYTTYKK